MEVSGENGEAVVPTVVEESVEVIVHPLVLLSTVDHYNRVAKDTKKRVVGVLLGTTWRGRIDITNSFAGRSGEAFVPGSQTGQRGANMPWLVCG